MALYLLHFDQPYRHARHYLGFAKDEQAMHWRIDRHYAASPADGAHHRLMQAVRAAGISFTLARVWPDGTRAQERSKKTNGHARRCPICRELRRYPRSVILPSRESARSCVGRAVERSALSPT